MSMLIINHHVKDFSQWKVVFDSHHSVRESFSLKDIYVTQDKSDPNNISIICEGEANDIKAFMDSDDLKSTMEKAGVVGEPQVFVGDIMH
ncbi:MAG: DUF3764 family protein [Saccharospirillaceae bacterium]|nr:DUF3764 family protein [Pseudomonadales bacterium]NRB80516.1 DUF3764 family protein [Saccharospirillaceae bacterium]